MYPIHRKAFHVYSISHSLIRQDRVVDTLRVTDNGTLGLGLAEPSNTYGNSPLPNTSFHQTLFAFWDDLSVAYDADSGIFYKTMGTEPHRTFVIEYHHVRSYNIGNDPTATITFQIRLHENSGDFDILYDNVAFLPGYFANGGASATIGVQIDETDYLQ